MFTELLSCDLSLFEELFSVAGDLYSNTILPMGGLSAGIFEAGPPLPAPDWGGRGVYLCGAGAVSYWGKRGLYARRQLHRQGDCQAPL